MGKEFEEGGFAGVGEWDDGVVDQDFSVADAADFVDVDDPGAVRAAKAVEGQLLFQGLQGHERHERLPVGFVDDNVVAFGLDVEDVEDVVQGDFGPH